MGISYLVKIYISLIDMFLMIEHGKTLRFCINLFFFLFVGIAVNKFI